MGAELIQATSGAVITQEIAANLQERFFQFLDVSKVTERAYSFSIKRMFEYMHGNGIFSPTREDLRQYRDNLSANCKPASVALYFTAIRKFFSWLESEGIYKDIAKNLKGGRVNRHQHRTGFLSADAGSNLLRSIDRSTVSGKRDYAMVLLMLSTGIRCHTVSLANIGDMQNSGSQRVLFIQHKGHSQKDSFVKLAPEVEKAISEYLKSRGSSAPDAPLFAATSNRAAGANGRIIAQSISRIIKGILRGAGIDTPFITAHSLRHTAGTQNILSGGTLEETMELLGHSDPSTTMIYVNSANRERNTSENRLAKLFLGL